MATALAAWILTSSTRLPRAWLGSSAPCHEVLRVRWPAPGQGLQQVGERFAFGREVTCLAGQVERFPVPGFCRVEQGVDAVHVTGQPQDLAAEFRRDVSELGGAGQASPNFPCRKL
jgi:hypothetical protein